VLENNGEALEYINEMVRSRGYVLPYHKLMANADFEVLKAPNDLVSAAYTSKRKLDKATKEPFIEVHFANVVPPPTAPRGLPGGPWQSNFTRTATGM